MWISIVIWCHCCLDWIFLKGRYASNIFDLIVLLLCLHFWKIVSRIIDWRIFVCLFVCFGLFLCHHFKCYPDHSLLASIVYKKSFVTLVTLKGFLLCIMTHFPLVFSYFYFFFIFHLFGFEVQFRHSVMSDSLQSH